MSMHSYHEVTDETMNTILFDDCPRCAEHAEHPFDSLDDGNLSRLWELGREDGTQKHKTLNEIRAINVLSRVYRDAFRLARLNRDFIECVVAGSPFMVVKERRD